MEQKILEALRIHFPDVQGDVTLEPTTDHYNGHILSESFKDMSLLERQRRVSSVVRETLGPEAKRVSMLFTYTPGEYEALQAS